MIGARPSARSTVSGPGGVRLALQQQRGDGPAIVLLHGLASTRRWWDLVTARLPGRHVVRWDQRGHGESTSGPGYRIADLAGDAAAVLDQLHLRQCIVAGHSLGAAVALQLAARRSDLVAGLCCVEGGIADPQHRFGTDWTTAQASMLLDRRTDPTPAVLAAWARGAGLPAAALAAIRANYRPAPEPDRLRLRLDRAAETALAYSLWCQRPAVALAAIDLPVTAVHARPANPARRARLQAAIRATTNGAGRRVRDVWLDGGHDLPLQHPGQVAAAITDLSKRARRPA